MAWAEIGAILAMTTAATQPLRLHVEPVEGGIRLEVIGISPIACTARYELEVTGNAGGNRSSQRGTANLLPDRQVLLASTTIGAGPGSDWNAVLRVQGCGDLNYEEFANSIP
ncbi:curli-like amyloid fiber formation chaperone CsgH [Sphingomonas edaphi]|uniref:Uncharacterized protein n=1 Tax=Sphingomonas edaphi TaxID=2315689 RepID=A0A418Q0F5_9SPHN|nr:curli-like amyloid fiber formation chaperone CsgH [Sphingomonas edaphi]RIX29332.1 hypothetical protein D3M59_08530 [Sphingomonas edaphi]